MDLDVIVSRANAKADLEAKTKLKQALRMNVNDRSCTVNATTLERYTEQDRGGMQDRESGRMRETDLSSLVKVDR